MLRSQKNMHIIRKKAGEKVMNRGLALFFSITGIILLGGIGFAISIRMPWLAFLLAAAAVAWIGWGFVWKARLSKRNRPPSG
jgi:cation transport ATPase